MEQSSWKTVLMVSLLSAVLVFALGYLYIWSVGL
jgi:hypothetical protein